MKSFVAFFRLCSSCLLIELISFAVRKFVKSQNNESFIELASSVRIGKTLVSFQKKRNQPLFSQCGPHASSITINFVVFSVQLWYPKLSRF